MFPNLATMEPACGGLRQNMAVHSSATWLAKGLGIAANTHSSRIVDTPVTGLWTQYQGSSDHLLLFKACVNYVEF